MHKSKRKHTSRVLFCRFCQWTFCEKYQFEQHSQEFPDRHCIPLCLKGNSTKNSTKSGYNEDWIKSNTVQADKFNIYEYLDGPNGNQKLDLPKIQQELNHHEKRKIDPRLKIIPNHVIGPSISLGKQRTLLNYREFTQFSGS